MTQLYSGCLVEVVMDTPGARHPVEARGLFAGERFPIRGVVGNCIRYMTLVGEAKVTIDRIKAVDMIGSETARDDLVIFQCGQNWNVYRKSDNQVLCQTLTPSLAPFKLFLPINWETYSRAEKWVNEGCIADLQEALGNLGVGFTKVLVVADRWNRKSEED